MGAQQRWETVCELTERMRCGDDLPLLEVDGAWRPASTVVDAFEQFASRRRDQPGLRPVGIYAHLPYCSSKCRFCQDFSVALGAPARVEAYLGHLLTEMDQWAPILRQLRPTSFYFGGGTPSLLSPDQAARFYERLHKYCDFESHAQLCSEANPNSYNRPFAQVLRAAGVGRMSFGVQSLDPAVLKRIGRGYQTHASVAQAVAVAREVGFESLNLDLVAGLPGQSLESFLADVRLCASLEPDLLWLHPFNPEADAFVQSRDAIDADQLRLRERMIHTADPILADMGFKRMFRQPVYHRSLQGHPRHFIEADLLAGSVLGLGHGAASRCDSDWAWAALERDRWESALGAGRLPEVFAEPLEPSDGSVRFWMFHIKEDLDRALYADRFGRDILEDHGQAIAELEELGKVRVLPDRIEARFDTWREDLRVRRYLLSDRRLAALAAQYQSQSWQHAGAGVEGGLRTHDDLRWLPRERRQTVDLRQMGWLPVPPHTSGER